jgi:hypothetical protein
MSAAIGFIIGLVLGASTGTGELGAFAGATMGMLIGVAVHGFGWVRDHLGDAPTIERHRVMCTPFGHAADLELAGDVQRGRWFDVKSCSLLRPSNQVDCEKGCLRQINLSGLKPGRPCECEKAGA